jgi:hypothetical protein
MLLRDVIEELRLGELSGANLGENEVEGISPFNYEKLTNYVNAALLAIYTRLPLRIRQVIVEADSTITIYKFDSKYAQTNSTSLEPIKYLNDLLDPFDNSLLKIDEVFDEYGNEMVLDDLSNQFSLFRPSLTSLQIPYPVTGASYSVIYRSSHEKLAYNVDVDLLLDQIVDLPNTYMPAIINYVLYKYRTTFDTQESQQSAMVAMQLFEQSIEMLKSFGLTPEDNLTSTKLEQNGWV